MPNLAPGGAFPPLKGLLARALSGRLPASEVRAEIARQIDAFVEIYGEAPAFVDGHQHVHVLPVVRHAVLRELEARGYAGCLWLRDPSDRAASILSRRIGRRKALVVGALAKGFRKSARKAGFETNEGFSGFAPFDLSVAPYRIFEDALTRLGPRPVIMCHPGYVDVELRKLDPAVESRVAELTYLGSDAFGRLLEKRGIRLVTGPGAG